MIQVVMVSLSNNSDTESSDNTSLPDHSDFNDFHSKLVIVPHQTGDINMYFRFVVFVHIAEMCVTATKNTKKKPTYRAGMKPDRYSDKILKH